MILRFLIFTNVCLGLDYNTVNQNERKLIDYLFENYDPGTAPFAHNLTKYENYSPDNLQGLFF